MGIFMIDTDTIRELREQNNWTQEQMADKLGITRNGYAKIERGESMPNLERLNDIATLFGVQVTELLDNKNFICQISENYSNNYYNSDQSLVSEIEKLKLALSYKDELLIQKDKEIELLRRLLDKTE
jgi:possible transcriptional regulator